MRPKLPAVPSAPLAASSVSSRRRPIVGCLQSSEFEATGILCELKEGVEVAKSPMPMGSLLYFADGEVSVESCQGR